jgi:hypothetical protein
LYRTRDGAADYAFCFEAQDRLWRVRIESQPSYQNQSDDPTTTQRVCEDDRYYIDWPRPIESLSDARMAAAIWAEKTQEYIKTGAPLVT